MAAWKSALDLAQGVAWDTRIDDPGGLYPFRVERRQIGGERDTIDTFLVAWLDPHDRGAKMRPSAWSLVLAVSLKMMAYLTGRPSIERIAFTLLILFSLGSCGRDQESQSAGFETFNVGQNTYRVPAEYVRHAIGAPATLWVTYPDLQPASEHPDCIDWNFAGREAKCTSFSFLLVRGSKNLNRDASFNIAKVPGVKSVQRDEFGYTVIINSTMPNIKTFYKANDDNYFFFYCTMKQNGAKQSDGNCLDTAALSGNVKAHFYFPYRLRGEIPAIEKKIDILLTTFAEH